MTGVRIKGLVKRYGAATAVASIDLDIAEGEFIVLLGPSGCGKTTTLRCVAGLEDITDGEISIAGQIVSSRGYSMAPERREIGMVFQSYAIWPHMSVSENVAFGLKLKKIPQREVDERVSNALSLVGLSNFSERGASQLSGGQQQRVALARAAVLEPRIMLFDEPLSNLDAKLRERMRFELRQLHKRLGITSIYVTHDQQEAMVIADRVVLLNEGRIDQIGSPADIYNKPSSRFGAEFIGLANIAHGKVSATGSATRVRLDAGMEIECAPQALKQGEPVDLVFRPENLRVSKEKPEGPNVFPALVSSSYFLGNITDIFLQVGDLQLRGQLSPPRHWPENENVWAQMLPESIVLLRT